MTLSPRHWLCFAKRRFAAPGRYLSCGTGAPKLSLKASKLALTCLQQHGTAARSSRDVAEEIVASNQTFLKKALAAAVSKIAFT